LTAEEKQVGDVSLRRDIGALSRPLSRSRNAWLDAIVRVYSKGGRKWAENGPKLYASAHS
jgi:hypothetical protein